MARRVKLDHAGMAALLKSQGVKEVVSGYADSVAGYAAVAPEVVRHSMDVSVTDRQSAARVRSVVTIRHPGGLGVQAKYGTLTRAIAAAGLATSKVKRRARA